MTEADIAPEEASELVPTSADEIRKIRTDTKNGDLVQLPDFLDGTPFVARLRRPHLMRMAELGQIPNNLTAAIDDMMDDFGDKEPRSNFTERSAVLEIIAEASLEEPKYSEVEDIMDPLQYLAIWAYVTSGVRALEPFRLLRGIFASRIYESAVEQETVGVPGDNG